MSEARNENNFVGYEYKDITVKRKMETIYLDSYSNFGWILEGTASSLKGVGSITIKFKRDRKIRNKAELGRLQRQFEAGIEKIEALEVSKVLGASVIAYIIGVLGTAFMAGSVFSYIGNMLSLSIILAVPGFVGWIMPYLCYSRFSKKKTEQVNPLIDKEYDAIYAVCEKANVLVQN